MEDHEQVTVGGAGYPEITVDRASWWNAIEAVYQTDGNRYTPVAQCCLQMELCPSAVVSSYSVFLWRMYQAIGGTARLQTIDQYLQTPALWSYVCEVIAQELSLIRLFRKEHRNVV